MVSAPRAQDFQGALQSVFLDQVRTSFRNHGGWRYRASNWARSTSRRRIADVSARFR